MSFYSHYRGRNIGRLNHFLYHYCGLQVAELVKYGNGEIKLYEKPFATYTWSRSFGEGDVPEFQFERDSPLYTANQALNRRRAIDDAIMFVPSFSRREEVSAFFVLAANSDAYRSAYLTASIFEGELSFFVASKNKELPALYCSIQSKTKLEVFQLFELEYGTKQKDWILIYKELKSE